MARIEWVHERLLVWAQWRLGGGLAGLIAGGFGGGGGSHPLARLMSGGGGGGYREAVVPRMEIESSQLNDIVEALPELLRAAVLASYLVPGEVEERARLAKCSVRGLQRRVEEAHRLIARAIEDQQERAAALQAQRIGVTRQASAALHERWKASEDTGNGYAAWVASRRQRQEDDEGAG